MLNDVIVQGRLVKDVELRYSPTDNKGVARWALACERDYIKAGAEERDTDFPNCIAFGNLAEFISKNFSKGDQMIVKGRIQTGSYQHKDGHTVYTTDIVADKVYFAGRRSENAQNSHKRKEKDQMEEYVQEAAQSRKKANKEPENYDFIPDDDDQMDLPF